MVIFPRIPTRLNQRGSTVSPYPTHTPRSLQAKNITRQELFYLSVHIPSVVFTNYQANGSSLLSPPTMLWRFLSPVAFSITRGCSISRSSFCRGGGGEHPDSQGRRDTAFWWRRGVFTISKQNRTGASAAAVVSRHLALMLTSFPTPLPSISLRGDCGGVFTFSDRLHKYFCVPGVVEGCRA